MRPRVAERDGDVAQPPLIADAANRAAFGVAQELVFGPGEERRERGGVEAVAYGGEVSLARRYRVAVPRARELAIVAAVHAIADQRTQRFRNAACVFDRQVRDAAPRVELVRRD